MRRPTWGYGRWKSNVWRRQWSDWAYGEPGAFHVAVQGERLAWFSTEGTFLAELDDPPALGGLARQLDQKIGSG